MSSIPGIDSRAPERTDTSSGSAASPKPRPARSSSRSSAASTCSSRPLGKAPERRYATHASVVIVKPAGTARHPSTRVISATFAPLPPSSSRISREPSLKSTTQRHRALGTPACERADRCGRGTPAVRARERSLAPHGIAVRRGGGDDHRKLRPAAPALSVPESAAACAPSRPPHPRGSRRSRAGDPARDASRSSASSTRSSSPSRSVARIERHRQRSAQRQLGGQGAGTLADLVVVDQAIA